MNFGHSPNKLIIFQKYELLHASFLFGRAQIKGWRKKVKIGGSIRQNDDNKNGAKISTDQLVYAQAGLIPQAFVRITVGKFWGSNIMAYHFNNFICVQLLTSLL